MQEIDRRSFIKGSALAAAGLATTGAFAASALAADASGSASPSGSAASSASASGSAASASGSSSAAASASASASSAASAASSASAAALTLVDAPSLRSLDDMPDPVDESKITKTVEAEIVVIGAGVSGLVTAASATEEGANVALFAASSTPVCRGGSNQGINTKTQQALGIDYTPESIRPRIKQELAHNGGRVDTAKWWKWINNSETAMDWIIDMMEAAGCETTLEVAYDDADGSYSQIPASHNFINPDKKVTFGAAFGEALVCSELESKITNQGGTIDYRTVAQYLEKDDSGRVTGVIAIDKDGNYVRYTGSKAVVMATGDFSQNKEMMEKYCPEILPLLLYPEVNYDAQFAFGGLMPGDGQKMGLWAGAAWQHNFPNAPMIDMLGPAPYQQSIGSHCGIALNEAGLRFMNEDTLCSYAAYYVMEQKDMTYYTVWDADYVNFYPEWDTFGCTLASDNGPKGMTPEQALASWESSVEGGTFVKGDTLEDVLGQLDGLDATTAAATIETYNGYVDAGVDADYHKNPVHLAPIKNGPFYGCKFTVNGASNFLCVTGGLRTSRNLEVCDENDEPIPGLYNVGIMVGDTYANIYTFSICGQNLGMNCITLPYLLGKELAAMPVA